MADSGVFDFVCEELEARTSLDRIEARGTVRLALKEAGLEPRTVRAKQMSVVVNKVLIGELESRGIEDRDVVCRDIDSQLDGFEGDSAVDTPEAVFERLGS